MRIDSHQHFWDLEQLDYAWMPPGDNILGRNYLPDDLKPILDEHRFGGTVLVQANTTMKETTWLLDLASANEFILGVVAWVDLTNPDLPAVLDQLQKHPRFKGVRHPVHDESDTNWLLRNDVLAGLKELERRDIPFDLLLRPVHLPLIPRLTEAVPNLRMVIDHIAKPAIAEGRLDGWAEDMAAAAKIPGLHCKLSGMITEANHEAWTAGDLRPYVQHVLTIFGPERLMFGSDWPVCKLAGSWKQVLAAFTQACGPLPQDVRDRILGDTATAFYRLATN
jgi:L-fucono-1,5-lactonase